MKKRIGLCMLLIAAAMGTAFAAEGRNISFKQSYHDLDVQVTGVTETKSGVRVTYKGLKTKPIGLWFLIVAKYKDNTISEYYNHEAAIGNNKTYNLDIDMKKGRSPSEITSVDVNLGTSKKNAKQNSMGPVVDQLLSAAAKLPDLDGICWSYSTIVGTLSKLNTFKDVVKTLKDAKAVFDAASTYRGTSADGDKEKARRAMLDKNLDFIESIGGLTMSDFQGNLLSLAVQGVRNVTNITYARYDYYNWLSNCAPWDDDLAEEPYKKYASLGQQLFDNGRPLDEIRSVFVALNSLENGGQSINVSSGTSAAKAKQVGRQIDLEQKDYKNEIKMYYATEKKDGIQITYYANKTMWKGLVFLARCQYNDGSVRDYYNTERAIIKGIGGWPKFKTTFPSSIKSVTVYLAPTRKELDDRVPKIKK